MVNVAALYPNTEFSPEPVAPEAILAPAEANAPDAVERLAEKLYAIPEKPDPQSILRRAEVATPADILKEREADAARKMFPIHADAPEVKEIRSTVDSLDPDAPADVREAVAIEYMEIAADFGMNNPEIRELAAVAKVDSFPDEATVTRWHTESTRALQAAFGQDTARTVADARQLVQRDPRLAAMLDRTGLGDHPKVILAVAHAARRLRAQGKLK